MKTWRVTIPIQCFMTFEVEATNKRDAISEAVGAAESGDLPEEYSAALIEAGKAKTEVVPE